MTGSRSAPLGPRARLLAALALLSACGPSAASPASPRAKPAPRAPSAAASAGPTARLCPSDHAAPDDRAAEDLRAHVHFEVDAGRTVQGRKDSKAIVWKKTYAEVAATLLCPEHTLCAEVRDGQARALVRLGDDGAERVRVVLPADASPNALLSTREGELLRFDCASGQAARFHLTDGSAAGATTLAYGGARGAQCALDACTGRAAVVLGKDLAVFDAAGALRGRTAMTWPVYLLSTSAGLFLVADTEGSFGVLGPTDDVPAFLIGLHGRVRAATALPGGDLLALTTHGQVARLAPEGTPRWLTHVAVLDQGATAETGDGDRTAVAAGRGGALLVGDEGRTSFATLVALGPDGAVLWTHTDRPNPGYARADLLSAYGVNPPSWATEATGALETRPASERFPITTTAAPPPATGSTPAWAVARHEPSAIVHLDVLGANRKPLAYIREIAATPDGTLWARNDAEAVERSPQGASRPLAVLESSLASDAQGLAPRGPGKGWILEPRGLLWIEGDKRELAPQRIPGALGLAATSDDRVWALGAASDPGAPHLLAQRGSDSRFVGVPDAIYAALAARDGEAWLVGALSGSPGAPRGEGLLVHVTDARVTWLRVAAGPLTSVAAAAAGEAWACGPGGVVAHAIGDQLDVRRVEPAVDLGASWARGPGDVWLGGERGAVFHVVGDALVRIDLAGVAADARIASLTGTASLVLLAGDFGVVELAAGRSALSAR